MQSQNTEIKQLSIIIPCYNEEQYVATVLKRVIECDPGYSLAKQIIIVNDGSADATQKNIEIFITQNTGADIRLLNHEKNLGKGSSIKTALEHVTGEVVIVQDADLEYDPNDFNLLLQPIMNNEADVVLGSRFRGDGPHKGPFILHKLVNKVYTFLSNILTGQHLSDIHTCYKMFKTQILKSVIIEEHRFGFDPEIIAKLGHRKDVRIKEVGISYKGRNFAEGKKINFTDGFRAFYCIIRYNLFSKK
ncbi:MAG: glycosyltransferase family 2 protein [Bacteroidetes bacterium]|nr:MAG: glycosyltransferase family 2 protein [Bacteroidota bacterium]